MPKLPNTIQNKTTKQQIIQDCRPSTSNNKHVDSQNSPKIRKVRRISNRDRPRERGPFGVARTPLAHVARIRTRARSSCRDLGAGAEFGGCDPALGFESSLTAERTPQTRPAPACRGASAIRSDDQHEIGGLTLQGRMGASRGLSKGVVKRVAAPLLTALMATPSVGDAIQDQSPPSAIRDGHCDLSSRIPHITLYNFDRCLSKPTAPFST